LLYFELLHYGLSVVGLFFAIDATMCAHFCWVLMHMNCYHCTNERVCSMLTLLLISVDHLFLASFIVRHFIYTHYYHQSPQAHCHQATVGMYWCCCHCCQFSAAT